MRFKQKGYFCSMKMGRIQFAIYGLVFWGMFLLQGCQSKLDLRLAEIEPAKKFMSTKLILDSIPSNYDALLYRFAIDFPKYSESPRFLYAAGQIAERRKNGLRAAEYAAKFIELFPNEKKMRMEMAMVAGHYFEQHGEYEKALHFYEILKKEFPNEEIGKQAATTIEMIHAGAITPEEQLDYLIKKNISAESQQPAANQ